MHSGQAVTTISAPAALAEARIALDALLRRGICPPAPCSRRSTRCASGYLTGVAPMAAMKSSMIGGILRVVEGHHAAGPQQQAAVIRRNLPALQRIHHRLLELIKAHLVAQHFQIVHHSGFAGVGRFQREIVVRAWCGCTRCLRISSLTRLMTWWQAEHRVSSSCVLSPCARRARARRTAGWRFRPLPEDTPRRSTASSSISSSSTPSARADERA